MSHKKYYVNLGKWHEGCNLKNLNDLRRRLERLELELLECGQVAEVLAAARVAAVGRVL